MARNPSSADSTGAFSPTSSFDPFSIPALMARLQLRPSLTTLDDLFLPSIDHLSDDDEAAENDAVFPHGDDENHRRLLAREEARLEREVIRIVHSDDADRILKPNSGQSVSIGEHNICVAAHEEPGSGYRVWEWHGHVVFFDEEDGFNAEYVYGNYFERLPERKGGRRGSTTEGEAEVKLGGLRDLIGDVKCLGLNGGGRVIHRNFLGFAASNSK